MHVNLQVRYIEDRDGDNWVLCFRHAVLAAMQRGATIETEVDDFDSEHDMRTLSCRQCLTDRAREEQRHATNKDTH